MNITKASGITCSLDPLRLLIRASSSSSSSSFSFSTFSPLPWIGAKCVKKKSGSMLQLHHRQVHYFSHRQLYHPSFKHCQLKQACIEQERKKRQQQQPLLLLGIQQATNLHTNGNNLLRRPSANNIILGNRIKEAIANGSPIVALESTVITHGLPEPDNLSLASSLEERITNCATIKREKLKRGETNIELKSSSFQRRSTKNEQIDSSENELVTNIVTPATVGIVRGQMIVGLSNDEIEYLATKSRSKPIKASRRDIPIATALGLSAGTTVSATMAIASSVIRPITIKLSGNMNTVSHHHSPFSHLSAIKVFATGGIGGVHKGGENSLDISADLFEFAKSPIGVVSSGFKSFLDTKRSLEYLETMGCTVISMSNRRGFENDQCSYEDDDSSLSNSSNAWLGKHHDKRMIELNESQSFVNLDVVVDGTKWLNKDRHHHEQCVSSFELANLKQQQQQQQGKDEEGEALFPGFYSQINSQKVKSPYVVKSIEEAARILFQCLEAPLLDRRGFLLAVPIPEMFSLDTEQMVTLLAKISNEVDMRSDLEGKEKTPMVLERFSRETGGASLRANIELLKNNAQVGALLAMEYSKLENKIGAIIPPLEEPSNTIECVTNSLVTRNDDINDDAGEAAKGTTKVKEAIFGQRESGYDNACLEEHQFSDDGYENSSRQLKQGLGQQILKSRQRVYEKLSEKDRNRRAGRILNEAVNKEGEDEDARMQLRHQQGISGTNFRKQKRQVDEVKQVFGKKADGKCEREGEGEREIIRQPVVVGCTMIDMHCRTKIDYKFKNNPRHSGVTFAGKPHLTLGGVGRNLATALNFLGHKPVFITALANDILASFARTQLLEAGLSSDQVKVVKCCDNRLGDKHGTDWNHDISGQTSDEVNSNNEASSCFAFVLIDTTDGQCEYVIADLECVKAINEEAIKTNLETIKEASLLVMDVNLSAVTIEYLIGVCHDSKVPIFIEPTDKLALPNFVTCMKRILHSKHLDRLESILCLSPNVIELKGILELFEEEEFEGKTRDATRQQQQQPVRQMECQNSLGQNTEWTHPISSQQNREISSDKNCEESSSEEQLTLEQIEQMAIRLMQTHLPRIKCLLVTMDKRGVLVALRSDSTSIEDKKASCEERSKYDSNNIESVKLMDEIGSPLSEKIHIKHFKPLKTIKKPISASGAGDSFAAGFISGLLSNQNLKECLDKGFKASQLALEDEDTISSKLKTLFPSSSANNN